MKFASSRGHSCGSLFAMTADSMQEEADEDLSFVLASFFRACLSLVNVSSRKSNQAVICLIIFGKPGPKCENSDLGILKP